MSKVGGKGECSEVILRYMKSNVLDPICSSRQSTLGFELIPGEISFKNQIDLQKLEVLLFSRQKSWGKVTARRWYCDIWRALFCTQFVLHGKVHLVLSWYPEKFRLKIKLIFRNWQFYVIFMSKVGRKGDCSEVI